MIDSFRKRILEKKPVCIRGGGSKDFYGGPLQGDVLDVHAYSGIVSYEPTELVITARCGTPLAEIESALAERRQMLAFEPPKFGQGATLGGVVATGLSGPRRASTGSVRDFVLGVRMMDGEGRVLKFGGEVMKNVAGFDVSRLMAGSLGTLGLILEVSLKVLPQSVAEASLRFELPQGKALDAMNRWAGKPLPVSATCWYDKVLTVRFSGAQAAVMAACSALGGEKLGAGEAAEFWESLCEQRHSFFAGDAALWRLSLPSAAGPLSAPTLIEWGGAQRWVRGEVGSDAPRAAVANSGGHATLFCGGDKSAGVFQPLAPALAHLHRGLKQAFDPRGIFNPGRLYPEL